MPEAVIFTNSTSRRPLYWDNFPVNDAEMYNELHIGYLSGRESGLYRFAEGLISNVMPYPLSSRIPLLTVCDYLWAPTKYDGVASWQKRVRSFSAIKRGVDAVCRESADLMLKG